MTELLNNSAEQRYVGDDYATRHPDWHLGDAPLKADDLISPTMEMIKAVNKPTVSVADVGGGVGGVMKQLQDRVKVQSPQTSFVPVIYEFASVAVEKGRTIFPEMDFRQKLLDEKDGPHDTIYLVDVLEHLEDPWSLLRICRTVAEYVVVRQPLLENYARFRHNDYASQRMNWGHITMYNARSFDDMMLGCGWKPLSVKLMAPWELSGVPMGRFGWLKKLLVKMSRINSSYFIDGFYMIGVYARTSDQSSKGN